MSDLPRSALRSDQGGNGPPECGDASLWPLSVAWRLAEYDDTEPSAAERMIDEGDLAEIDRLRRSIRQHISAEQYPKARESVEAAFMIAVTSLGFDSQIASALRRDIESIVKKSLNGISAVLCGVVKSEPPAQIIHIAHQRQETKELIVPDVVWEQVEQQIVYAIDCGLNFLPWTSRVRLAAVEAAETFYGTVRPDPQKRLFYAREGELSVRESPEAGSWYHAIWWARLGDATWRVGHIDEARDNFSRALDVFHSVLGEEHRYTLGVRDKLSDLLGSRYGDWKKALLIIEPAYAAATAIKGPPSLIALRAQYQYAICVLELGDYHELIRMAERMLRDASPEELGVYYPKALHALGAGKFSAGYCAEALKWLGQAYEASVVVEGEDDASTVKYLADLAQANLVMGKHSEAATLYKKCLPRLRAVLDPGNLDLLRVTVQFAEACFYARDHQSAREGFEVAAKAATVFGSPQTEAAIKNNAGALEHGAGNFSEAEQYYASAATTLRLWLMGAPANLISNAQSILQLVERNMESCSQRMRHKVYYVPVVPRSVKFSLVSRRAPNVPIRLDQSASLEFGYCAT